MLYRKIMCAVLAAAAALSCCARALAQDAPAAYITPDEPEEAVDISVFQPGEVAVDAAAVTVAAPYAILIEPETGAVIYEKAADTQTEPASVTKIMTMLLVAEAVEAGSLSLDDMVTVSAHAASMGGTQIFLEEGERMSVRDMLKSVAVSSANDAAVALGEHIAGSEQAFVALMNRRSAELGMKNTVFANCTGLDPEGAHLVTARDVAIMSRELLRHGWITDFTSIWMDTVRDGAFGLSNTNKLVRHFPGATGVKTGYTSSAGFCVSASAQRDGVTFIAVILKGESSASRFGDASALLNFAFANYTVVSALPETALPPVAVKLGNAPFVQPVIEGTPRLMVRKTDAASIERTVSLPQELDAPVNAGDGIGTLTVTCGGSLLGEWPILAGESVARLSWWQVFCRCARLMFAGY